MPSLLLIVFTLQLAIHLVNTVGANAINELLWDIFNRLPTPTSKTAKESTRLKWEVLRQKREMNAVSAQDDFAKWAKLRRQHDKAEAELEKHTASHAASKAKFDTAVAGARWLATNGLRYFLQFWYSKQPMFWLPKGLMPGYVEWFLAFPRAPTGSISIQLWGVACLAAIKLVSEAIVAVLAMTNMSKGQAKAHPLAFEMQGMKQGDMGKSRKEL